MTQVRPHRAAMSAEQAAEVLGEEARTGRHDGDVAAAVIEAARPAGLSDREIEILRLVATGMSNPEIAKRLYISRRTAEHHVQNIYVKIGVSSRAAATLFALEKDLLLLGDVRPE